MKKTQDQDLLTIGFKRAREITERYAKTFYFASSFLPKDKKNAAYSIYAICRISDEAVDNISRQGKMALLEETKRYICQAYEENELNDPLLAAFHYTVKKYSIPKDYFDQLAEGMLMDTTKMAYNNFEELHDYCYRVAGVVGLIMLKIFGYNNSEAERCAVKLGIAMQLTNILRDIKEDFALGRCYIPEDEMTEFGVSELTIEKEELNEKFIAMLKFQIKRARKYYQEAKMGIPFITNASCRFVARIMAAIYGQILTEIEKNKYNVFAIRARVPAWKKIMLTTGIAFDNVI